MEIKSKTRTENILTIMHILAWVAFIGLMVEVGAILFSYIVSCINPEAARNLYGGLNLYSLSQFNFWYYSLSVSFIIALSSMKAYVWFLVTKTLSRINLSNPFKMEVVKILEEISYVLFAIWVVGILNNGYNKGMLKITAELLREGNSGEFIFMAGLIFIISQIYKRGVEIQSENDLTV